MRKHLFEPATAYPFSIETAKELGIDPKKFTIGEVLILRMYQLGMAKGDQKMIKELITRMEGKPVEMHDVEISGIPPAVDEAELKAKVERWLEIDKKREAKK